MNSPLAGFRSLWREKKSTYDRTKPKSEARSNSSRAGWKTFKKRAWERLNERRTP